MRAVISKIERGQNNEMRSNRGLGYIDRTYRVREKGGSVVLEELEQRVVAKAAKVKRYDARNEQQLQSRLCECDKGRLY